MQHDTIGNAKQSWADAIASFSSAVPEVFRFYAASEPYLIIDLDEATSHEQRFRFIPRSVQRYVQFFPSSPRNIRVTLYAPTFRVAREEQKAIEQGTASARDALDRLISNVRLIEDDASVRTALYAGMLDIVKRYRTQAITAISNRALSRDADEELGALLIEVGSSIEDPATERYREWLVTRALLSESPYIRHAAANSVTSFAGNVVLTAVKEAEAAEDIPELKRQMQRTRKKLEQRIHGPLSETY